MQQIIFSYHFHLTQHVSAQKGHLQVFDDNTTRYWREQKARDKLQIAEELNNGLMKIKSRPLQQIRGNKIQFETRGRLPWELKNFTKLRRF
jgi:hypothetical protein